jgi:hypothetical protein
MDSHKFTKKRKTFWYFLLKNSIVLVYLAFWKSATNENTAVNENDTLLHNCDDKFELYKVSYCKTFPIAKLFTNYLHRTSKQFNKKWCEILTQLKMNKVTKF